MSPCDKGYKMQFLNPIMIEEKIEYTLQKCTQRGYQKSYIEEGQIIQWPNEKGQKDKQRSTKHYT